MAKDNYGSTPRPALLSQDQFDRYVAVQKSGVTNMWNVPLVSELSGLTEDECLDAMSNYSLYKERFAEKHTSPCDTCNGE